MAVDKLLAVLVLLQCSAGLRGAAVRSSIIGGQNAPKGRWPWLVYLDIKTDDGKKKWHCSGTILNEKWVLTAGRCWDDELWSRWDRTGVWVGTYELKMPSKRYMFVDGIVRPNDFRQDNIGFNNDLALIMLKKTLNLSDIGEPVNLPREDENFDSSSECWIAGWGDVGEVPLADPGTLQMAKVSILPQKDCKAMYPSMTDKMLCAGDPVGGKDACHGDFGDPLVCRTSRGFVQVGIMSFGSPKGCGQGFPSIYTKVTNYVGYINAYINQATEELASA